eukprot:1154243-Pelagomonas_calceolata.AAC.8
MSGGATRALGYVANYLMMSGSANRLYKKGCTSSSVSGPPRLSRSTPTCTHRNVKCDTPRIGAKQPYRRDAAKCCKAPIREGILAQWFQVNGP